MRASRNVPRPPAIPRDLAGRTHAPETSHLHAGDDERRTENSSVHKRNQIRGSQRHTSDDVDEHAATRVGPCPPPPAADATHELRVEAPVSLEPELLVRRSELDWCDDEQTATMQWSDVDREIAGLLECPMPQKLPELPAPPRARAKRTPTPVRHAPVPTSELAPPAVESPVEPMPRAQPTEPVVLEPAASAPSACPELTDLPPLTEPLTLHVQAELDEVCSPERVEADVQHSQASVELVSSARKRLTGASQLAASQSKKARSHGSRVILLGLVVHLLITVGCVYVAWVSPLKQFIGEQKRRHDLEARQHARALTDLERERARERQSFDAELAQLRSQLEAARAQGTPALDAAARAAKSRHAGAKASAAHIKR